MSSRRLICATRVMWLSLKKILDVNITQRDFEVYRQKGCTVENHDQRGLI